jgi:hypothetical protein
MKLDDSIRAEKINFDLWRKEYNLPSAEFGFFKAYNDTKDYHNNYEDNYENKYSALIRLHMQLKAIFILPFYPMYNVASAVLKFINNSYITAVNLVLFDLNGFYNHFLKTIFDLIAAVTYSALALASAIAAPIVLITRSFATLYDILKNTVNLNTKTNHTSLSPN